MEQHCLTIKANNQPTALEQLLRVTRYRGFKVDHMSMECQAQSLNIQVWVNSSKPIHLLENQLRKLVDVDQVFVENARPFSVSISS